MVGVGSLPPGPCTPDSMGKNRMKPSQSTSALPSVRSASSSTKKKDRKGSKKGHTSSQIQTGIVGNGYEDSVGTRDRRRGKAEAKSQARQLRSQYGLSESSVTTVDVEAATKSAGKSTNSLVALMKQLKQVERANRKGGVDSALALLEKNVEREIHGGGTTSGSMPGGGSAATASAQVHEATVKVIDAHRKRAERDRTIRQLRVEVRKRQQYGMELEDRLSESAARLEALKSQFKLAVKNMQVELQARNQSLSQSQSNLHRQKHQYERKIQELERSFSSQLAQSNEMLDKAKHQARIQHQKFKGRESDLIRMLRMRDTVLHEMFDCLKGHGLASVSWATLMSSFSSANSTAPSTADNSPREHKKSKKHGKDADPAVISVVDHGSGSGSPSAARVTAEEASQIKVAVANEKRKRRLIQNQLVNKHKEAELLQRVLKIREQEHEKILAELAEERKLRRLMENQFHLIRGKLENEAIRSMKAEQSLRERAEEIGIQPAAKTPARSDHHQKSRKRSPSPRAAGSRSRDRDDGSSTHSFGEESSSKYSRDEDDSSFAEPIDPPASTKGRTPVKSPANQNEMTSPSKKSKKQKKQKKKKKTKRYDSFDEQP